MTSARILSKQFLVILLTIILIPVIPTVVIILSPLFLIRRVVALVAKWMDPTLGEMLPPLGTAIADQKPYSDPLAICVSSFFFSEHFEKTRFQHEFTEKIIQAKSNNGNCIYPEFKQKIVSRFGYYFWQNVDKFRIDNHIRYEDEDGSDRVYNQSDVTRLEEIFLKLPFNPNYGPWEFVIFRSFKDPSKPSYKSAMIFRAHHCFIDGYSFMGMMQKLSHAPVQMPLSQLPKVGLAAIALDSLLNGIRVPYGIAQLVMNEDKNSWLTKAAAFSKGKIRMMHSGLVDLNLVKGVKKQYNVTMTALLYTIFAGGFIKLMKEKREFVSKVRLVMPLFEPRDGDALRNVYTWFTTMVDLDSESILKTMMDCNEQVQKPKSAQRAFSRLLTAVAGRLPIALFPDSNNFLPATLPTTIFQGPTAPMDYFGYVVEEWTLSLTPPPQSAFMSAIYSYNGFLRFSVFADQSTCPTQEDMDIFLSGIDDTINELMEQCSI